MRKFLLLILVAGSLCMPQMLSAQMGLGTNSPSPRSVLDISGTNKGVLIPRIDYNNRPTGAVESGMLIYVTANGPAGNNRFYYYNGTQWEGVKNTDDAQTLSLSDDTLRISQGNYVLLRNIYSQLGYTQCGTSYVQLTSDVQNCGSCGNICSFTNASGFCANSSCYIGNCNSGFGNCDNGSGNGCETNLVNNVSNCGACGNICSAGGPNVSSATCSNSTCGIVCNTGFLNCDASNGNGCEINSNTDAGNCGSCGHVCGGANNASGSCTQGLCGFTCNGGFLNCNNNNTDGCEINALTDASNCGSCGNICSIANGTAACNAGICGVAACDAGFLNCNNVCRNLATDPENCGACGNFCIAQNGTAGCASGHCTIASCNAGFANCNFNTADGCETNLQTDSGNCGLCGNVCPSGQTCIAGACH